ncbi:MAG: hypothetical protein DSY37_04595 [Hyperthermus sp.]|nr:MAG: hypothetical protein DSY37_04595 [Hyperthermus sp.]
MKGDEKAKKPIVNLTPCMMMRATLMGVLGEEEGQRCWRSKHLSAQPLGPGVCFAFPCPHDSGCALMITGFEGGVGPRGPADGQKPGRDTTAARRLDGLNINGALCPFANL